MRGLGLFTSGEPDISGQAFEHAIHVRHDVVVPEPNHPPALRLYYPGAFNIGRFVGVLAAVELDRQPQRAAGEVHDMITYRILADEFCVAQLAGAEAGPEKFFGFGAVAAQGTGFLGEVGHFAFAVFPSPNPLPRERAF